MVANGLVKIVNNWGIKLTTKVLELYMGADDQALNWIVHNVTIDTCVQPNY